jgi:integrase
MTGNHVQTKDLLEKIPNVPYLYRHSINGLYYGIKKVSGKKKSHSLGTTDRKLAERWLKDWIHDLDRVDAKSARTTLASLLDIFSTGNAGKALKTQATNNSIVNIFKKTWKPGLEIRVSDVKPSQLSEWLGQHEGRLKNTSYNRYAGFLKQVFEIAVTDRMIANSPFDGVKTKWKKPQKPVRQVPTVEQFQAIVKDIRAQRFSADAESSADFIEFLGLAGVGQAEAGSLTLGDIDWEKNRIHFRRRKTHQVFYVPIYNHLKPLLERLSKQFSKETSASEPIFKVRDAKKALAASCKRLAYHNFSQRNIRQALIRRLWQSQVDHKLISKWQGHQDGGKLILDTYTEVFSSSDAEYEKAQIAKIV